jgi:hypothetical protein
MRSPPLPPTDLKFTLLLLGTFLVLDYPITDGGGEERPLPLCLKLTFNTDLRRKVPEIPSILSSVEALKRSFTVPKIPG